MTIRRNYPGRACLLGEHCDWAGGASLAVPLPLGITVEADEADRGISCRSKLEGRRMEGRWTETGEGAEAGGPLRFVSAAVRALVARGITVPPTRLEVTSDLPPGRGFSSSAAFTLAILDALAHRAGVELAVRDVAELAYHVEHDLLGVRCGRLDQLACSARQPLFLRWQDGEPVEVRPVAPGDVFHLVVAAFSTPRDTTAILAELNRNFFDPREDEGPMAVRSALETWGVSAHRGAEALARGDAPALGAAMNAAQRAYDTQLEGRLPSLHGPRLRETCIELARLGAVGAKFSGAGGDGSVVALFETETAALHAVDDLHRRPDVSAWYCRLR